MTSPTLLHELLADQQSLTAVEAFALSHEEHAPPSGARYRNLIPLEVPRAGEQYAFEVELDKCSGCKACVTACHSLNGLDDNETWREVGLLTNAPKRRRDRNVQTNPILRDPLATGETRPSNVAQHVTSACHHCVDPACLNGCPVLAYEKDPCTGIVRHLDDQCIGCQYCVLKCPYDVPKYNPRLGIVRKCDMCANRLAAGEAPACVQACPSEAIRITKVETESVTIEFRERGQTFIPGAPAGDYTLPTTRYISVPVLPGRGTDFGNSKSNGTTALSRAAPPKATLIAADAATLRPQPTHWPLVLMLVFSQGAVGVCGAAALIADNAALLLMALVLCVISILASIFHLGRPLGAWRFFLGLKRSWLSREILVFGIFVSLLGTAALLTGADFQPLLRGAAALAGLIGVFCSMMIYHDTRRTLWWWQRSAALFFGSTFALGAAAFLSLNMANSFALAVLVVIVVAKLLVEIGVLRHVTDRELTSLKKTALLVTGPLQHFAFARGLCATAGIGAALLFQVADFNYPRALNWLPFAFVFMSDILERVLFFRAVDAPKMPGGLSA